MKYISSYFNGFLAAFFGTQAIIEFCVGDLLSFALCGLLCYCFVSFFEDAWIGANNE